MNYDQLIAKSKLVYNEASQVPLSPYVFTDGAKWMCNQLNQLSDRKTEFTDSVNYTAYGLLKYGISLLFFLLSVFFFVHINILLVPLAVVIFYFAEVHFLFLFPLLIDGVQHPLQQSVKATYSIGLFTSMYTVFRIGLFMITGLFNISTPFRNWHIGCMAIIIWYQHDVRSRI